MHSFLTRSSNFIALCSHTHCPVVLGLEKNVSAVNAKVNEFYFCNTKSQREKNILFEHKITAHKTDER